jgi:hypothetical protein
MLKSIILTLIIICFGYSNELSNKFNSLDAYSEYSYSYHTNGTIIDFYTLLKYQYNAEKEQFGFRDILLFSLREIQKEAKNLGYKDFYIVFNSELNKKEITIDEYLNNFNTKNNNFIYPYYKSSNGSSIVGSALSLGANVALATVAAKNISSGNNVSASTDVFANSVDGIMTNKKGKNIFNDLSNKFEVDSLNNGVFYNTLEQRAWFMNDKEYKFESSNIVKISVAEVEKYFEKNPFRIKELYSTDKYLITRGIKK